jgi:pilus assembly protein Flp/PilA
MIYAPREEGQGLVEYAMILMSVALVVMLLVYVLGPIVGNMYSNVLVNI